MSEIYPVNKRGHYDRTQQQKNCGWDHFWRGKSDAVSLNQPLIGFCNGKLDRIKPDTASPEDFYLWKSLPKCTLWASNWEWITCPHALSHSHIAAFQYPTEVIDGFAEGGILLFCLPWPRPLKLLQRNKQETSSTCSICNVETVLFLF